jgi:glycogen phosphorylase
MLDGRSRSWAVRLQPPPLSQLLYTMDVTRTIAYFSMEIGLEASIPTYSGGLGILAGDTIRAAADMRLPLVAVTVLHRKGYFRQTIDEHGNQHELPSEWDPHDFMRELPERVIVGVDGRDVALRVWQYDIVGLGGHVVPVFFLDSDLHENHATDRALTDHLYGGDATYRLSQEILLGIGGARMLHALGYANLQRYHMNEGHSSLLTLELLRREAADRGQTNIEAVDVEVVRRKCVFTTHTPVPAGHDQFPLDLARQLIGPHPAWDMPDIVAFNGKLNLTYLALGLSNYVNGVAHRHGEVSRQMFAGYDISAITNGVHAATWVSPPFQRLYNRYVPDWRNDNYSLRYCLSMPSDEIWEAHEQAKLALLERVRQQSGVEMDPQVLTIGFGRRATPYKRSELLFSEPETLRRIAAERGPLQIIFAGKAHPRDDGGKQMIRRIHDVMRSLNESDARRHVRTEARSGVLTAPARTKAAVSLLRCVYLADYDIELAKLMVAGVDVWLNTPQAPLEASGTSGMKAALNAVPSLSVLDGWWVEGCIDGVTGWAIGEDGVNRETHPDTTATDAASLYWQLEQVVLPTFYQRRARFIDIMRSSVALNGSFFNTQRMLQQYAANAYAVHGLLRSTM